jgi:hypothetical protein
MPHFIDDSGWPFVHASLSGVMTIEDMRDHQQRLEDYHRARRRYALIVDLRDLVEANAKVRKFQSEWLQKTQDDLSTWAAGIAFLTSSPMIHGVMTALFWMVPPKFAYKISRDDGVVADWLVEQMKQAQLHDAPGRDAILKRLSAARRQVSSGSNAKQPSNRF